MRRRAALAIFALTLPFAAPPAAPAAATPREVQNEAVARRFYEQVVNPRAWERLPDVASQWVVQHDAPAGEQSGVKRLAATYERLAAAFPDFQIQPREFIADGNKVAVRYRFTGTHKGELFGAPASGRSIAVWGVDYLRVEDGKIREVWGSPLTATLLSAAGALQAARPATTGVD